MKETIKDGGNIQEMHRKNEVPYICSKCKSTYQKKCLFLVILKTVMFSSIVLLFMSNPIGDPSYDCKAKSKTLCCNMTALSYTYNGLSKALYLTVKASENVFYFLKDTLYKIKLSTYAVLAKLDKNDLCQTACELTTAMDLPKEQLDHAIEDEITDKLSTDLMQSIERKFQADLQRAVDMVLVKIKLLLQNGTTHIQDKVAELQSLLDGMRENAATEVEECLSKKQNVTTSLAEKALHQMVVCGYALIGHDPAQALKNVIAMKAMINEGLKPIRDQKPEINKLLKVCGHEHESLKKVIKCVISKSPVLKSSMMDVTGKLISGVVELTKLMAHGAMHEACLIEVIKTIEDEAFVIVKDIQRCVYGNDSVLEDMKKYMAENNATVLEVTKKDTGDVIKEKTNDNHIDSVLPANEEIKEMKNLVRRMLDENSDKDINRDLKHNLQQLQKNLGSLSNNIDE